MEKTKRLKTGSFLLFLATIFSPFTLCGNTAAQSPWLPTPEEFENYLNRQECLDRCELQREIALAPFLARRNGGYLGCKIALQNCFSGDEHFVQNLPRDGNGHLLCYESYRECLKLVDEAYGRDRQLILRDHRMCVAECNRLFPLGSNSAS